MPFKKTGKNTYRSPSGRKFTARQVRAYYATGGFKRSPSSGKRRKTRRRGRSSRRRRGRRRG